METIKELDVKDLSLSMPDVQEYRQTLYNLGEKWNMLAMMGQITGTGTDMDNTREGFQQLTDKLLHHLSLEMVKKTAQEMASKAQVAVDVLIRNLFERTADIGFLSTDDDIRNFLNRLRSLSSPAVANGVAGRRHLPALPDTPELPEDDRALKQMRMALENRFREYVAKYSVYFDIILLDTSGCILARLNGDNIGFQSKDPLIAEALSTPKDYVEIFRHCDLLPDRDTSLVYAFRVTQTNHPRSEALGVLCLCFRFEDEMAGIFKNLIKEADWSVLTLLDQDGRVISSSDPYHIPPGAVMTMVLNAPYRVVRFGGREYLAKTCRTKGYQNYFGMGWFGHILVPLGHAFENSQSGNSDSAIDAVVLEAIMNAPRLFSEELRTIPLQANRIQEGLDLTIWNGNVHESGASSKLVLQQIRFAGAQTKQVFEDSINNLHKTVITSILNDAEFQASLAVDIMDRNLYERADDARWWALTSAFRHILGRPSPSAADLKTMGDILGYINALYTVYTLLVVYDTQGRILAVSNASGEDLIHSVLDQAWAKQTLSIKNSQKYSVSEFEKTRLYHDRHTYIYGASILHPENTAAVVGGIGIVFDSEPQFQAMLMDSLPRNDQGQVLAGAFGLFADRKGMIISSTDPAHAVGAQLDIDKEYLILANGRGRSGIIEHNGRYYALGVRTSSGYREYKTVDEYKNDVICLIFVPLSEIGKKAGHETDKREKVIIGGAAHSKESSQNRSVATFYIGRKCYAFFTDDVVEAIHSGPVSASRDAGNYSAGTILYYNNLIRIFNVHKELGCESHIPLNREGLAVVVVTGGERFAVQVDELGEIAEIATSQIEPITRVMSDAKNYLEGFVKPKTKSGDHKMVIVLNPDKLLRYLC